MPQGSNYGKRRMPKKTTKPVKKKGMKKKK